jgi:ribosomal protein S18 acetylase RimI-like enzyme
MLRYFYNSCFIVEDNDKIIGFVMGFSSQADTTKFFLWQIGVTPRYRGQNIGTILLKRLENEAKNHGCKRIELTVDPENVPSQKLFEKNGYFNMSVMEGETIEINGNTAVKDYYKPGRHFILFQKELP